jgi:hypothetical protein
LSAVIEVQVDMLYGFDVLLGSGRGVRAERVHADINVRPVGILVAQPSLELRTGRLFGAGDALDGLSKVSIEDQECDSVASLEIVENVLGRRRTGICRFIHSDSLWLSKMNP